MSSSNNVVFDRSVPDQCRLKQQGWSDNALPAYAGAVQILQGWLASESLDPKTLPTPAELEPLLRMCEDDSPAASNAALLLTLLETGRWLGSRQKEDTA